MTMDTDKANALVVTAVGVSAALVLIRDVHDNKMPPARFVIGSTVAAIGLATMAQFAPPLAGGIAALMLTTSVLVYGGPAWQILATRTGSPIATGLGAGLANTIPQPGDYNTGMSGK